mmetsp:Transcript_16574/g.37440  ORF Transcript_16574/g.37440 Transcript_16574/m.37440 type:complete len:215 (+) Transcript_16574:306-950(+)
MLGRPGLASCPGREFLVVEARIVARPGGKVNGVGKDVGLGDTELRRDGLNHQPESPGDEKDLLPLPVKRGHQLLHSRSESRGLLLEERLDGPFRRLNDRQPRAQRFLEGDRARHGLRGEPRHLLALPKVRREVVDALARADGAVNIEADHLGSGPESGDVAFRGGRGESAGALAHAASASRGAEARVDLLRRRRRGDSDARRDPLGAKQSATAL